MATKLNIGIQDFSCYLIDYNVNLTLADEDSFSCTLGLYEKTIYNKVFDIQEGMEIKFYIDGKMVFGGIIWEMSSNPIDIPADKNQLIFKITARDYKCLLIKRNTEYFPSFNLGIYQTKTYSQLITQACSLLFDDQISEGTILANQNVPQDFIFEKGSYADFFDALAELGGFVWKIDKDKKINFYEKFPSKLIDIKDMKYELLESRRTLDNYYNKVFVISDYVEFTLQDMSEINRMKPYFGTGIYGTIINESEIETEAEAEQVANSFLNKHSYPHHQFRIRSITALDIGDKINIEWQNSKYLLQIVDIYISNNITLPIYEYNCLTVPPAGKEIDKKEWFYKLKKIKNNTKDDKKQSKISKSIPFNFDYSPGKVMIEVDGIVRIPARINGALNLEINGKIINTHYINYIEYEMNLPFRFVENYIADSEMNIIVNVTQTGGIQIQNVTIVATGNNFKKIKKTKNK